MKVLAAPGTRCPMEGNPRERITDKSPREVPDTAFYRRLIKEGSLVLATETEPAKPARRKSVRRATLKEGAQAEAGKPVNEEDLVQEPNEETE